MKVWLWLVALVGGLAAVIGFPLWTLTVRYEGHIYNIPQAVPERPVALVFGAGYWPDGTPSDVMKDRVEAAADLYHSGRVRKVLFSGDNRFVDYNEPGKMREYALSLGLPEEAIILDYAGRRTYDSCYRARDIFELREVVLVSQRYHLPRALYICQRLGLDAVGYGADRRPYVHIRSYWLREVAALWLAWWELWVTRPVPVLGDPIPILKASTTRILNTDTRISAVLEALPAQASDYRLPEGSWGSRTNPCNP